MFIEAELFDSMRSVQAFWEAPMMIDLLDRFLFWHQHMRPFYDVSATVVMGAAFRTPGSILTAHPPEHTMESSVHIGMSVRSC